MTIHYDKSSARIRNGCILKYIYTDCGSIFLTWRSRTTFLNYSSRVCTLNVLYFNILGVICELVNQL